MTVNQNFKSGYMLLKNLFLLNEICWNFEFFLVKN